MTQEIDIFEGDFHAPQKNALEIEKPQTSAEKFEIGMLLGRIQGIKAVEKTVNVIGFAQWAYIKENKSYRALKGHVTPEGAVLSGTWEEFCTLAGTSRATVEEMLINHELLTNACADALESAGVSVRQMRTLRKLPSDEKNALIEAAKSGDKEQLIDLAETLIERHIKEKAELVEENTELAVDLKDAGRRINNMNAEIERQELQIGRLTKKSKLTEFEPYTEDVRDECMHLQAGCDLHLNSIKKLFEDALNAEQTAEHNLRIEQICIAATVAASRALFVLEFIQSNCPFELPARIQGQHILTSAEAERWLLDSQMLESRHNAEKLAREVKRDAEKPKGRGRPTGSKNKVEE